LNGCRAAALFATQSCRSHRVQAAADARLLCAPWLTGILFRVANVSNVNASFDMKLSY
jgi:hypothetical protein